MWNCVLESIAIVTAESKSKGRSPPKTSEAFVEATQPCPHWTLSKDFTMFQGPLHSGILLTVVSFTKGGPVSTPNTPVTRIRRDMPYVRRQQCCFQNPIGSKIPLKRKNERSSLLISRLMMRKR